MASIFFKVDDKFVPIFRLMWIADVPHFCGEEDCVAEGRYEIRLEQDESLWADREERDAVLEAVEAWQQGREPDDGWE